MQVYSPDHLIYTTPAHPSRQLSFSQSSLGRRFTGAVAGPSDVKLTFSAYEFFIFNLLHGAIWNTYKPEVAKPLYPMAVSRYPAFTSYTMCKKTLLMWLNLLFPFRRLANRRSASGQWQRQIGHCHRSRKVW